MAVDSNAFDAWIKGDRPKDKEAADKYFAERDAKINAAPVQEELPTYNPDASLSTNFDNWVGNKNKVVPEGYQGFFGEYPKLQAQAEKDNEIGDSFFKDFSEKAWPSANAKTDNRSDEQIIEDYVENNPEEAKQILPEDSDLHTEAEQVNDGDKRTDEVKNEAVSDFIEEEPTLADTIVEEAREDNTIIDNDNESKEEDIQRDISETIQSNADSDTIVDTFAPEDKTQAVDDDYFAEYAKKASEEESKRKGRITSYDVNRIDYAPVEEKIAAWPEEDQKYLKAADKMGLLKEWEERIGGSRYKDADGNLQFVAGTPVINTNYDKVIKEYKKTLDSIPEYYSLPSDLSDEDLKVAARQAKKKTKEQYGFTKEDAQNELYYRAGKGNVLDTKPQPRWDVNRIQDFQSSLNKAANAINPNDPNSIKELGRLNRKREQLLLAIKQKKYYAMLNDSDYDDVETDAKGRIEVVKPINDEILETAVDPNEAAMELMKQEEKEKKAEKKRFDEFVKQQSAEIKKKYNGEEYVDPEEKKKLNDPSKQLAIYDPKAIMEVEQRLEETDKILEEKEEKIRRKWKLPKIGSIHTGGYGNISASGFSEGKKKAAEEITSSGARLNNKAGPIPTGPGSAAVSYSGANISNKKIDDVGAKGGVKSIGPHANVEQVEQPAASSKGNKYDNSTSATSNSVRPGSLVGWSSVSNKGGGRFAANKGKAPHFSGSNNSQTGSKLSAKKQADARNITKKEVAQKILSESRRWQTNERGEKDSGADLLPVRLYVKDDKIEVSIVGTGRKRKSLDSVNDQELALIEKQL